MINNILKPTGIPYKETMFSRAVPDKTYAVYHDDVEVEGPDNENRIYMHNITVELYEPKPDPKAEAAIEAQLNARGIKWTKQSRYWIAEAHRYQVIYEFTYITKT